METLCEAMYLYVYRGIKGGLSIIAIMLISPIFVICQIVDRGTQKLHIANTGMIFLLASILMIGLCIYTLIQLG